MRRIRNVIVICCAATIYLTCTGPGDDLSDEKLAEAPLPTRVVDLSPLVTEDLPLRVWGKKMLTDWGFRLTNEFEDVGAEEPFYVVNSYWTLSRCQVGNKVGEYAQTTGKTG